MPLAISIKADFAKLSRSLSDIARKQIPFATAQALTAVARNVQAAEKEAIRNTFDNPTPFTVNSVGVRGATKATMTAVVFVKDIAAAYLEPFETGGAHKLNSRALLNPKGVNLNQYGNMPRGALARYRGRKDVFVGAVTFRKSGQTVSGVWQRPDYGQRRDGGKGTKGALKDAHGVKSGLKLLVRFGDALPVKERLGYRERAQRIIERTWNKEFGRALGRAMGSARG